MMLNPAAEPELQRLKLVAVIRSDSPEQAREIGRALLRGGVGAVEITFTVPDAPQVIRLLAVEAAGMVGAGTVLNASQANEALDAGAAFIVSPLNVPELAPICREAGALTILGALTPNEIAAAVTAQADLVKVFPVSAMGGLSYIKSVLEPLPTLQLMVSGGVRREEINSYFENWVRSVAIGAALMPPALVQAGDWSALEAHARSFTQGLNL